MRAALTALLAALALVRPLVAAPDMAPVKAWIDHSRTVKSVAVEFTQERWLRTVRKPLVTPGRFWFRAPGAIRWQVGEPAKMIAVQKAPGADLLVLEPREKVARVFTPDDLKEKGGAFAFVEASFPDTLEAFEAKFDVASVEQVDGQTVVTGQLKDRRMAVAVLKIVFRIDAGSRTLRGLEIWFRDGSKIVNQFTKVTPNAPLEAGLFDAATDGYRVEK